MQRYHIVLAGVLLICPTRILGHSGGLDAQGGHHNRKTGEYHYHGGSAAVLSPPVVRSPRTSIPTPRLVARTAPPEKLAWSTASKTSGKSRTAVEVLIETDVDSATMEEINEKHAASRLYFARKLIDDGKVEAAKRSLNNLLREFPKSASAAEAKLLLKTIP